MHSIWSWHPPIGIWIGILGLLGVLVPLVRDLTKIGRREKAFWTSIMFLLLLLEIKSVYQDRNEHDRREADAREREEKNFLGIASGIQAAIKEGQQQFDATMKKTKTLLDTTQSVSALTEKNLANITGGSSFAYIRPQVEGAGTGAVALVVWNHGNEILTGVTLAISRTDDPTWGSEFFNRYEVGTIAPHDGARIPITITPKIGTNGLDHYWAMISAQNGTVDETMDFKESKKFPGQWAVMLRVSQRVELNEKTTAFPLVMLRGWSDEPNSEQKVPSVPAQIEMLKRTTQQETTKKHEAQQPK